MGLFNSVEREGHDDRKTKIGMTEVKKNKNNVVRSDKVKRRHEQENANKAHRP